jgi:ABC-type lipoprotein export system ATPase subunit
MKLFVDLNQRGTTVVMVTHNETVAAYAGRLVEMRDGHIIRDSGVPAGPDAALTAD